MRKLALTPSALPIDHIQRSLKIPSSQEWLGIFNAALLELTNPFNFEQLNETDMTPDEVAAKCFEIYVEYLSPTSEIGSAPTPYWDTDTDVDDQEPVETQTWYGTVSNPEAPREELDFVENALVWVFTGFIAAATLEIGAAPAVLFNTIAPRFILATKRGDVGEIIRILVDGQESARVDTSSYTAGEVIRTSIVADPELSSHEIMIVQVG